MVIKSKKDDGQLVIDVYQSGNDIVIKSIVGNIFGKDLDISVTKEMITIKGKRLKDERVEKNSYYHREIQWGSFSRSIILPEDVDPDSTKASIKNGVLTIRLPQLSANKIKKIRVG